MSRIEIFNPLLAAIIFLIIFGLVEKGRSEVISRLSGGFTYRAPELEILRDRDGLVTVQCEGHINTNGVPRYFVNWAVGNSPKLIIENAVYDTIPLKGTLRRTMNKEAQETEIDGNAGIIDQFIIRGLSAVTVAISPIRVNEKRGEIVRLKECSIRLESEVCPPVALQETYYNLLQKSIINADEYIIRSNSLAKENYLIIAESGFHNALQPLIEHREKEYNVTTVDAALLGGNQMLIINKIKELYNNPETRPTYLLLVGGFPLLPMNNPISTSSLGTPLNDLWYGAVDGDDHYADILVGRFSLNSGENAKVANCVAKTIAYEKRGLNTPKKNLYIAAGGPFADHAIEPMNYVDNTYFVPTGFSSTRFFESEIDNISELMVSNEVNEGLDFLFYSGHGNWDHWKTGHYFGDDVASLTNDSYPIVFSFACLTGDLSTVMGECFGETWLNEEGGAVAFLGASTETTWEPDDHFQRMVVDGIFDSTIATLQGAITFGKMSLDQNFPKYGVFYSETFNLCGDPALKVAVPGLKTAIKDAVPQGDKVATLTTKLINRSLVFSGNQEIVGATVRLHTIQGRVVKEQKINSIEAKIRLNRLAKGVYGITVLNGTDVISSSKICLK